MKDYIENCLKYFGLAYNSVSDVIHHMFCVNGNGLSLNNKLKLNRNYDCKEVYSFPNPKPFTYIYPWSKYEEYQPFRNFIGCKDVDFKETVNYFIECLKLTPKNVAGEWLDNIDLIREVLDQEVLLPAYDKNDAEGFVKSLGDYEVTLNHPKDGTILQHKNSVKKVWFLDAQWSDLPVEIEDEVRQIWKECGLGNDNYICKRTVDDELFEDYPKIYLWCRYKGIPEDEDVIIHWWW